ncbi:MAG: hypothetical protein U9R34_00580 [Nanoarchaeota archaeon]|nr:hypothetical protein [Nanoarchaeota archaeon]
MSSDVGISKDPIESAAKGVTKGALEWTNDKLKPWVVKLRNKELAFIRDSETIETAKEQRKKGEYTFFSKYVADEKLRVLFQMGLTLRNLEKSGNIKTLRFLKVKIRNTHKREGLHIAYFVQNGLFSEIRRDYSKNSS